MRNPSIHIKLSEFKKIAIKLDYDIDCEKFFKEAMNNSIMTNTKGHKITTTDDTRLFNQILFAARQEAKHICSLIQREDSAYLTMIEICNLAKNFSEINKLDYVDGFKAYCSIGLRLMKSYGINKFKYHNETINNIYQERQVIKKDKSPELTIEIRNYFFKKLNLMPINTKDYHFVLVKDLIESMNIGYKQWIDFQLEELSFIETPEPFLLYGEKAIIRWQSKKPAVTQQQVFTGKVIKRKGIKDEHNS